MDDKRLNPAVVWNLFKEICQVPRPSFHTEAIQQWLLDFAAAHHLDAVHDAAGNVLIRKAASAGMESVRPVALQSHIDMVCEKNNGVDHDFTKDPIDWYVDDEGWMRARGTTLGADNGIGMAMALAALTDETLKHGPLECLFTVDEEVGLIGAAGLQPGLLQARTLINLDNEDDGYLCIGCAGGVNTIARFDYHTQPALSGYFYFRLSVTGLQGGHSGSDIHLGRANANKLLVRFLYAQSRQCPLYLADFKGGNLSNAIPREAECVAAVPFTEKERLRVALNLYEAAMQAEYGRVEPSMRWTLESVEAPAEVLTLTSGRAFISSMYICPNDVLAMSHSVEGLVETSTNLASVKPGEHHQWIITTSQRSSLESAKTDAVNRIRACFELAGMTCTQTEGYPGWAPNPDSPLLNVMVKAYEDLNDGQKPVVYAIHAGLECGLFLEKYPGLDMVSFGPTMTGVHSPDEKIYLPAVKSVWNWLTRTLETL